jgi:hypothetical protein
MMVATNQPTNHGETKMTLTEQAQDDLGSFVEKANRSRLVIRCANVFDEQESLNITPADVADYYAHEARNLTSGCRTLAGLTGDWRQIDHLAALALEWFKRVNIVGMRRAARRLGLEPRF